MYLSKCLWLNWLRKRHRKMKLAILITSWYSTCFNRMTVIMLGKHSFLGPTDPQFICRTELGVRGISAQDVEAQFERAREECRDPTKIGAWIPILKTYGPDLLE